MTQLLVNMAKEHIDISDYLSTLPHAHFRVSFTKSRHYGIYDLILSNNKEASPANDVQMLYNYLKALTGN